MTTATKVRDITATLNRQQANALVLYLNYKKYHWLTYGPHFRDIHLLFDEQATATIDLVDEFAERAIIIDGKPVGDPSAYLPLATVPISSGELSVRASVEEAIDALDTIVKELHEDAEAAAEAGDIGTADLYTRVVQTHQKNRWFLRQLLKKNDGF
jgi:starvation-inducible DNA-binding protein